MRPVRITIDVPQRREDVYDFLDVLSNHERFTGHMLRDWHYAGPQRGVGSKARVTAVAPGYSDALDVEVIEAERPARNVERNVGRGGRRVATGTYTLAELPGGGTRVTFEYAVQRAPWSERLAAPVIRALARRNNQRALEHLAGELRSLSTDGASA